MDKALRYLMALALSVPLHGQVFLSQMVQSQPSGGGGSFTIGAATGGSTLAPGLRGIYIVPFITGSGASGYTFTSAKYTGSSGSGTVNFGLYDSTGATCSTGVSPCAGALLCSQTGVTYANSLMTFTPSSCGTLAANTYYFAAFQSSAASQNIQSLGANVFCPGNGFYGEKGATPGTFVLPNPMGGSQTQPNAAQCPAALITLTAIGATGVAPVPWVVLDYSGGTNGNQPTTATLLASTHCSNGTYSIGVSASTTYVNSPVQSFAANAICNGTNYTGGSLSIQSTSTGLGNHINYNEFIGSGTNGGSVQADLAGWVRNTGNTQSNGDQTDIGPSILGGNEVSPGIYYDTTDCATNPTFRVEISGASTIYFGCVPLSQSTWYLLLTLNVSGGTHRFAVYNTSGTQIATTADACVSGNTSDACLAGNNSGNPTGFQLGTAGSNASTAGTVTYGPAIFDPTGVSFTTLPTYAFFPDSPKTLCPDSPSIESCALAKAVMDGTIPRAQFESGNGWYSYALHRYFTMEETKGGI